MAMLSVKELVHAKCKPCAKGLPPLFLQVVQDYLRELPEWSLSNDGKSISRLFVMKDFMAAVQLINCISEVAEPEDHHPDLHLTGYRKLQVDLSTHSIGGLSENDFILAAKITQLPKELKKTA